MIKKITQEQKLLYKTLLPSTLNINIHKAEEGGFWVEIKELPGCRTQGETIAELIHMVNDAVYAYLGIPPKLSLELGFYMPVALIRKISIKRINEDKLKNKITLDQLLNNQNGSSIKVLEKIV